jgi:hypothetical protein
MEPKANLSKRIRELLARWLHALLFDVIAEKADQRLPQVRAQDFALFVVGEEENVIEEFLAALTEEFVVGHGDLHSAEG